MKLARFLLLIVALLTIGQLISCSSKESKSSTAPEITSKKDTSTLTEGDTAVNYMALKKYLPTSIPGFKTEGYPDTLDRFTGEPTGESRSRFTSGGRLSFIKHLYKRNQEEISIEIIDYREAKNTLLGLSRMYDMKNYQDNDQEKANEVKLDQVGVLAKEVWKKSENNGVIHTVVCDRFIINVQGINLLKHGALSDAFHLIDFKSIASDYCN